MQMTDRGLLALVRHEGLVPGPYLDVAGVWTFGIGHTAAAGSPDPARMERGMPGDLDAGIREAFRVFRTDLATYEAAVRRAVTVPLAPHEFDALVSFHYNTGGIARAALTRHLNAGNRAAAADAFMGWLKPAAIRPRREAERDLFRNGRYPTGTIPVWAVDRTGRVDFSRPIRRLTEDEALALLRPGATPVPAAVAPTPVPAAPAALSDETYVAQGFTPVGTGLRPFSVAHVEQPWRRPRTPGDLTIRWTRRSRALAADNWGAVEASLAEEIEAYEVEILDGASVKRALSSTTTSAVYTAAQQTADWGAPLGPGNALTIRIFQISALVGRGAPKTVNLSF